MASESTEDSVTVSLPPELAEWLDQRAAERGTDRETALARLLAAHRAAGALDDGASPDDLTVTTDLEAEVRDVVADRLPDIAGAVADRLDVDDQVEAALDDRMADLSRTAADEAAADLEDRIEAVEDDFMAKLTDVRERVVQVKKEADRKASGEHDHPELERQVDDLASAVEQLRATLQSTQDDLTDRLASDETELTELSESLADAQEKLRTVAYVVRDLREQTAIDDKRPTSVEGIKRSAAKHDLARAACEACGEGVEIALLTDPECPHCGAVVTDVVPKDGLFGKPKLVTAHGIEAADAEDE